MEQSFRCLLCVTALHVSNSICPEHRSLQISVFLLSHFHNTLPNCPPDDLAIDSYQPWLMSVSRRRFQYTLHFQQSSSSMFHHRSILLLPVLPPRHLLVRVWKWSMLCVDLIYTAFLFPVTVAFGWAHDRHSSWYWVGLFVGVLYIGDLLLCFVRGMVIMHVGQVSWPVHTMLALVRNTRQQHTQCGVYTALRQACNH